MSHQSNLSSASILTGIEQYVDLGDLTAYHIDQGSMTMDGGYYTWDISSIVPEGTKAVNVRMNAKDGLAGATVLLRPYGHSNNINALWIYIVVANQWHDAHSVIAVVDQKLTYRFGVAFDNCNIVIKGYWK